MKVVCEICPHHCGLEEGQKGLCRARSNRGGQISCDNYGMVTALALDPIEKKPLRRFHPGSYILSLGSYGCNLRCSFCQNNGISMSDGGELELRQLSPRQVAEMALRLADQGNIGVAYTYNEPLVGYEFVRDCAEAVAEAGMKNVIVTNGTICREPLEKLLPRIDAMNIDLKAFTPEFYRRIGGDLDAVKQAVELAAGNCHVELTTLVIPGENDSEEEMEGLAAWVASVDPEIPLHVSRFFPQYRMKNKAPTEVEAVYRLASVARRHLKYVYEGNC